MPIQRSKSEQIKNRIPQTDRTKISDLWNKREYALPCAIILTLTALLYSHALNNEILSWDDHWHITYNADIHSLSINTLKTIFTSYYSNMYQPIVTLTFAVEYYFFGLNPAAYHTTNVLFHLLNVVLVFFLVLRLSQRREIAIIAACLFGVHPMHVESVAWITERKDVVYAFFYLCGLISYIYFLQKEGKKYYWIAFLFFVMSLFSKSTAITFPIVLLLIDGYVHRKIKSHTIAEKLPFFLLSIVFGVVALHSQSETTSFEIFKQFSFTDRFFLMSYSLCYYIFHLFIPMNLSAFHSMPDKIQGVLPLEYYFAVIPVFVLIFLSIRKDIFQNKYIFGLLFFFATISLNIHIIPFGKAIVAERYSYIPFIGIYFLLGQFYCFFNDHYPNIRKWKNAVFSLGVLVTLMYSCLTYQRIGVWKNTLILFRDASLKADNSKESTIIQALGYVVEAEEKTNARKYSEAIDLYNKAIALDPQRVESYGNRGIAKHCLQDYEGAMRDYSKAIELNPSFSRAYANRAAIFILWNKQEEACKDFHTAYNLGLTGVLPALQAYCP
jgi:protein O-mannosyl-transferase